MAKDNRNRLSRRNVIRSTAGLSSLGAASLLATGTGAAASGTRGKYGYGIDDSGYLVYYGDDDDAMIASVEAMNEAKDEGKLDFSMQNGAVTINSQTESQTQPDTGKIGALRWSRSPVCPGNTKYGKYFAAGGIRHKLWIDHCDCNDLVDLLTTGVELAAFSAAISALYANIPAAIASGAALFLMRTAKGLISNNDEGSGIVVGLTTSYIGGNVRGAGLEPQA